MVLKFRPVNGFVEAAVILSTSMRHPRQTQIGIRMNNTYTLSVFGLSHDLIVEIDISLSAVLHVVLVFLILLMMLLCLAEKKNILIVKENH